MSAHPTPVIWRGYPTGRVVDHLALFIAQFGSLFAHLDYLANAHIAGDKGEGHLGPLADICPALGADAYPRNPGFHYYIVGRRRGQINLLHNCSTNFFKHNCFRP